MFRTPPRIPPELPAPRSADPWVARVQAPRPNPVMETIAATAKVFRRRVFRL
jgi:hypothetical protein